jgi:hypothetical protein
MSARENAQRGWGSYCATFEQARDEYNRAVESLAAYVARHTEGGALPAGDDSSLTAERQAWARLKLARRRMRNFARWQVSKLGLR